MSQLQDLRARMRLDNTQFSRGLRQARGEAQGFSRSLTAMFRAVAAPLAAALSFRALIQGARQGAQEIDQVAKSARALDGSIGGVRAAELALSEAGVSASVFRQEMQNLNRQVASGRADAAMRALGIEAAQFARLDADEKVALLADRIHELGLDAGSTGAILRDLGIRNRDMALVMMQGGEAVRAARRDIEEYGLAISAVDSARIEEAQDRIGRLSVVGQYFRQELALQLTPALGEFARALTESMREGGAARGVIDSLVSMVPRLTAYITAAAGAAVAYGSALGTVAAVKWLVVGATNGLRAALVRLGLPVLILAAGEMIFQFQKLMTATGGWGEALDALRETANAVWEGIVTGAGALEPGLGAVFMRVRESWFRTLSEMTQKWVDFVDSISTGLSLLGAVPGLGGAALGLRTLGEGARARVAEFTSEANAAGAAAAFLGDQAEGRLKAGADQAKAALAALIQTVKDGTADSEEFDASIRDIYTTLSDIGDGSGGGAAGRAAAGIDGVTAAADEAKEQVFDLGAGFARVFTDAITGARSLQDALKGLLDQMSNLFLNAAFSQLFKGIFPSLSIPGFATGVTNFRGGLARINEQGGEIVNLPRGTNVIPHDLSKRMLASGGTSVQIINNTGAPVREKRQRGPDGREVVRVLIGEEIGSGRLDKAMSRYGLSPVRTAR